MSQYARVENLDEIKHFAAALRKFQEKCSLAISDGDGEINRVRNWLERDQPIYWQNQLKKRKDALEDAKKELRQKTLYKSADGGRNSAIEERKKVQKIQRMVEEAEQKLANIRRWRQVFEKEVMQYKGQVQPLSRAVEMDMPVACAKLERMIQAIERYLATSVPSSRGPAMSVAEAFAAVSASGAMPTMARDGEAPDADGLAQEQDNQEQQP